MQVLDETHREIDVATQDKVSKPVTIGSAFLICQPSISDPVTLPRMIYRFDIIYFFPCLQQK
jgi:hypothetical protein